MILANHALDRTECISKPLSVSLRNYTMISTISIFCEKTKEPLSGHYGETQGNAFIDTGRSIRARCFSVNGGVGDQGGHQ